MHVQRYNVAIAISTSEPKRTHKNEANGDDIPNLSWRSSMYWFKELWRLMPQKLPMTKAETRVMERRLDISGHTHIPTHRTRFVKKK